MKSSRQRSRLRLHYNVIIPSRKRTSREDELLSIQLSGHLRLIRWPGITHSLNNASIRSELRGESRAAYMHLHTPQQYSILRLTISSSYRSESGTAPIENVHTLPSVHTSILERPLPIHIAYRLFRLARWKERSR